MARRFFYFPPAYISERKRLSSDRVVCVCVCVRTWRSIVENEYVGILIVNTDRITLLLAELVFRVSVKCV
jgi:hypothetical protein